MVGSYSRICSVDGDNIIAVYSYISNNMQNFTIQTQHQSEVALVYKVMSSAQDVFGHSWSRS